MTYKLCIDNIPEEFQHLLPLAQKYGISDDGERSKMLDSINEDEIKELKEFLHKYDENLDTWLAGVESEGPHFSKEYIAYSALRMAADEV